MIPLPLSVKQWRLFLELGVVALLLVALFCQTWRVAQIELQIAQMERNQAQAATVRIKHDLRNEQAARQAEHRLEAQAAQSRQELRTYEQTLTRQRAELLARVRAAEARAQRAGMSQASSAPSDGEALPGDAGAKLPGTIGPEHVEEAYRADLIRKHLIECYAQYDVARVIYNE